MAQEEKPESGKVIVFPAVPLLPSGVVDMGTITRLVSEADLANNPPDETEPLLESVPADPKPKED